MAETLYIATNEVRFDAGKFDSDNRYIRGNVAASSTSFAMPQGQTVNIKRSGAYGGSGAATRYAPNWHFDNTVTEFEFDGLEASASTFSGSSTLVDI